jgi:hypothetical protein
MRQEKLFEAGGRAHLNKRFEGIAIYSGVAKRQFDDKAAYFGRFPVPSWLQGR